ncbi:3-octaprenyl-4-hydroxybenzoate carboxy-lyase [Gallibacterium genomosp. 3]|uniref:Flavin prenyltransferase UbiX n=1 Tax=Gallibacterium genomosp. 3 TaxID=505345 RepID=A0A1A7NNV7_9PAST|nr:UbiX family flavin prenyltransferase [Gallibacterium genomosp. 3]OBW91300.1 3-octaprenyl-4-hydroxybenzoate carboxy-lyase [Gallibacterium genomosp. 3]
MTKRIIVGISGASGIVYAIDLLQTLRQLKIDVEIHGVVSQWARENLRIETTMGLSDLYDLMDYHYANHDMAATIASGSYLIDAMVIVPASMKTVAGIACGFHDSLIGRAADVTLKEQRKLIIVPRETPLSVIHLENLTKLAKLGAHIIPPIPAFYHPPQSIDELIRQQTTKMLDSLGIAYPDAERWQGSFRTSKR